MCLAVPAEIVTVQGDRARVRAFGHLEWVDCRLVPGACPGDFVLVHTGFAIQKLQPADAEELMALWRESGAFDGGRGDGANGGPV